MDNRTLAAIRSDGNPPGDGSLSRCVRCGLRPAILPIAYCLDCWSKARGVDDLVTAADIAERVGNVESQTVSTWAGRHEDFPRPVLLSRRTFVWRWREVAEWLQATGRMHA